eukprot:1195327-Prorocentrum_minimum.AAC.1
MAGVSVPRAPAGLDKPSSPLKCADALVSPVVEHGHGGSRVMPGDSQGGCLLPSWPPPGPLLAPF